MDDIPVAVISGSSRGIGLGLARYFIEKGYRVAGCSRTTPASDLGHLYHHTRLDISNEDHVKNWVRNIKVSYQRIDVLICNAAHIPKPTLLAATTTETLRNTFNSNVLGTYFLCREVSKVMMLRRQGRIINFSSMATTLHNRGTSAYSSSKAAIIEISKILARELAPLGITCNVIAPSLFQSESLDILGEAAVAMALQQLDIKRPLTIDEISHVVEFLIAPKGGCTTGQVLYLGLVN